MMAAKPILSASQARNINSAKGYSTLILPMSNLARNWTVRFEKLGSENYHSPKEQGRLQQNPKQIPDVNLPVVAIAVTTASTMSPSTSSMTAAPSTVLASVISQTVHVPENSCCDADTGSAEGRAGKQWGQNPAALGRSSDVVK